MQSGRIFSMAREKVKNFVELKALRVNVFREDYVFVIERI